MAEEPLQVDGDATDGRLRGGVGTGGGAAIASARSKCVCSRFLTWRRRTVRNTRGLIGSRLSVPFLGPAMPFGTFKRRWLRLSTASDSVRVGLSDQLPSVNFASSQCSVEGLWIM
jgi:hypothetical protein